MKKFLLPALFMCLYAGASAAETPKKSTDANLFGHVVDRETHEHLPYATVAVTGTAFGATTDASGHYFLKNLPEGELTLEVRALGYAVLAKKVTLERGQTLELNFEVVQSGISMDEVVRLGQPLGHAAARSPCAGERAGRRASRKRTLRVWRRGFRSSPACGSRTTVRTAASRRCASTDLTAIIRRFSSIRIRSFRP